MIRAGIVGAAGYTAGELLRILVNHPRVQINQVQSESQAGKSVVTTHKDLIGEIELDFVADLDYTKVDVIFLCKGHGESVKFLEANPAPEAVKVVDLSHDYRLKRAGNDFVYGLPEINKALIMDAKNVANPGCFATCIQLGLLPAAQAGFIKSDVHVSGITGSTGAGQSLSATSHFSWRNNNISVYKAFNHQHLGEIGQSLNQVSGKDFDINFIPYRGNFTRGIIVTSYFTTDATLEEVIAKYQDFYLDEPFVFMVDENPDVKQVVNSNKAIIYLHKHDNKLMVVSIIDNLLKGASGQAVQNMNLMFGLEEEEGLKLKSVAF